ncbi:hypothetical protein ES703_113655 [subsurface metagenome]
MSHFKNLYIRNRHISPQKHGCFSFFLRIPCKQKIDIPIAEMKQDGIIVGGIAQVSRVKHTESQAININNVAPSRFIYLGIFRVYSGHELGVCFGCANITIMPDFSDLKCS